MQVYRITNRSQAYDLSGTDACSTGGRWNKSGTYVIYTAGSSSLAILEALVHVEQGAPPQDLAMITMELPDERIKSILNYIQIPTHGTSNRLTIGQQWRFARKIFFRRTWYLKCRRQSITKDLIT